MRRNFFDLMGDVVLRGICCYCGACGAFCENVHYENEIPIAKDCMECGMCYDLCPRTGEIRLNFGDMCRDELLGDYRRIICSKARDESILGRAQDGGVTTALLCYLLEESYVDACIVAKSENWIPQPFIAKSSDEVIASAGSKYTQCPSILALGKALDEGLRVAFVGLPCHIQAVRKIQYSGYDFNGEIVVAIGLFCMETFNTTKLFEFLGERGVDISGVKKFDIKKGKFIVEADGSRLEVPIKDMKSLMRDSCKVCCDFTAELSDISVGSVGSPLGWNTVIIRSKVGEKIFEKFEGSGWIKTKEITEKGLNALRKLAEMKKKENSKNLKMLKTVTLKYND